jgi:hypothetical protein
VPRESSIRRIVGSAFAASQGVSVHIVLALLRSVRQGLVAFA